MCGDLQIGEAWLAGNTGLTGIRTDTPALTRSTNDSIPRQPSSRYLTRHLREWQQDHRTEA